MGFLHKFGTWALVNFLLGTVWVIWYEMIPFHSDDILIEFKKRPVFPTNQPKKHYFESHICYTGCHDIQAEIIGDICAHCPTTSHQQHKTP